MRRPTTSDIRGALRGAMNTTERESLLRARIGKIVPGGMITDVPNDPGKVFIRLYRNGAVSLTSAINRGAPLRANPDPTKDHENDVWVKIDPKTASFVIERRVEVRDTDQPVRPLDVPPHNHAIGSGNEDPVEGLRFLPGLVHKRAADSLIVKVRGFTYKTPTGYAKFATTTFDLEPYLPTTANTHAYAIVGFNPATEAIVAVTGTEYPTTTALTDAHIEEITFSYIPLAAVKLQNGQTRSPDYRDFVDLREWFSSTVLSSTYAPIGSKFWVSQADSTLTNEVNLGALTTGVVYITVSGGIATPSTATQSELATALLGANGGANQVVKRATTTGALSVGALANADIPTTLSSKSLTGANITDYLQLTEASTPASPANTAVRLFAADVNGRTKLIFIDSNGFQRTLTEQIILQVRNATGSTIAAGKVVRVSGVSSQLPSISLAIADTVANAEGILAIATESIANGSIGWAVLRGSLNGIDTSALSTGDVYLSGSSSGDMTNSAPTVSRRIGTVLVIGNPGILFFSPEPVSIASPAAIGAAPKGSPYITKTTDSDLTNEFALGSLATGLLHNTTTTGVPTVVAGSTVGDFPRWNGSGFASARPYFGDIIASATYGSDQAVLQFTDLTSVNGSFDHLVLMLQVRTSASPAARDGLVIRLNNDATAGNYFSFTSRTSHSGVLSTSEALGTIQGINPALAVVGNGAGVGIHSPFRLTIWNYRDTIYKLCTFESYVPYGASGQFQYTAGGCLYQSTSAITRVDVFPEAGATLKAGGYYSIYGIGQG
jgi:hypothetical protein